MQVFSIGHLKCIWASSGENVSSRVSDQVRLKLACSTTEASMRLEILDTETRDITLSRQWTTKALIRLRRCAGWSAPLLFAYDMTCFLMARLICMSCFRYFRKTGIISLWLKKIFKNVTRQILDFTSGKHLHADMTYNYIVKCRNDEVKLKNNYMRNYGFLWVPMLISTKN